jgi:hypothetical protein
MFDIITYYKSYNSTLSQNKYPKLWFQFDPFGIISIDKCFKYQKGSLNRLLFTCVKK